MQVQKKIFCHWDMVRFVSEKPFHFIYVYRDGDAFSGSGRGAEPPY